MGIDYLRMTLEEARENGYDPRYDDDPPVCEYCCGEGCEDCQEEDDDE